MHPVGRLRFACFDLSSGNPEAHIDRAITRFVARAPDVSLDVSVEPPQAIESGLLSGQFDVGVVPVRQGDSALDRTPLYNESMVLCCGESHAPGRCASLFVDALVETHHVATHKPT